MSWTLRDSICVHYFCGRCPLGTSRNPFHKSCHKMNQSEIIESIKNGKLKASKIGNKYFVTGEDVMELMQNNRYIPKAK